MHESNALELEDDTPVIEEGMIDSMGLVKLVMFMESEFNIRVEEEEIEIDYFRDLNSMTVFVEKKIKAGN
jgi:acyl carrier protein